VRNQARIQFSVPARILGLIEQVLVARDDSVLKPEWMRGLLDRTVVRIKATAKELPLLALLRLAHNACPQADPHDR